jgi:hypothetical protein
MSELITRFDLNPGQWDFFTAKERESERVFYAMEY